MSIARRRVLAAVLVMLGAAADGQAAKKIVIEQASSAPAWVREAAAREVPGGADGVGALLLHDETIVAPRLEGGVRVTRRIARRVLRPDALVAASSPRFTYRSDDSFESAGAWNLLPDGTMRRPDPKDDISDLPWTSGVNAVDDVRLRAVDIPGVVVGSVTASESVIVHAIDTGAFGRSFGDVDEPTGLARLTLEAPAGWTVGEHLERADGFARTADGSRLSFTAASLPRLPHEIWAPSDDERLPFIWVSWRSPDGSRGMADWGAVARWYRELADPVLAQAGEAASVAARLKPADPAVASAAMRDAFKFASRDVRYVSIQLGIGGYKPATPAATCANRYGDCKAKSFLMRSLVDGWGWKAHPVLVRTASLGPVTRAVPTPAQFNHCIAAIRLPEGVGSGAWNVLDIEGVGRVAFMDATSTSLGPWELPEMDQGTLGLLVLPDGGRLIELPVQPPAASRTRVRLDVSLDEMGRARTGTLEIETTGTHAGSSRSFYSRVRDDEALAAAREILQSWAPGATLGERLTTGVDSLDGPVLQTYRFTGGRVAQRSGDMLIVLQPAIILPFASALLPPPPRTTRLDLGLPEERHVEMTVRPPQGWRPEALPRDAQHATSWFTLDRAWTTTDGGWTMTARVVKLARSVEPADYTAFRDASRRAATSASEGIMFVPAPVASGP